MKPVTFPLQAVMLGASVVLSAAAFAAPRALPRLAHNGEVHPPKSTGTPTPAQSGTDQHGATQHGNTQAGSAAGGSRALPPMPRNLPAWLNSTENNEIFYERGPYNFAIYEIDTLARDMNGVAVGHSMAYEDLVTGRAHELETKTFERINRVLKNPPKLMPAERMLSPKFARRYGVLELVFDWTHVSHAQTIDNYVSTWAETTKKDAETAKLWNFYETAGKPYVITGLPMNMAWLDSQPYSQAFRRKYPKVNALFWGYHWLQTSVYDGLRGRSRAEQEKVYEVMGKRYREVELYNTKRPFMPMMGETSPNFSAQFPEIANGFDNLHMLHDMVNDILASDWIPEAQKQEQIKRAIYIMSPDAHQVCKPGENRGMIDGILHDHRFMEGMPGMGMMKNGLNNAGGMDHGAMSHGSMEHGSMGQSAPAPDKKAPAMPGMDHGAMNHTSGAATGGATLQTVAASNPAAKAADAFDPTKLMWMPKMGWMNMSQCHHCSMPLTDNGVGDQAWKASTVTAEGWSMRVRCALCARDMSAETKGGAILTLATEDPNRPVTVFSDEQGNLSTLAKGVVFLEEKAGHPRCSQWSQAFTSRVAFDAYVKDHPRFKDAKPLSFEQWATREAEGTPDTYEKEEGPVKNPYAADLKARGIKAEETE